MHPFFAAGFILASLPAHAEGASDGRSDFPPLSPRGEAHASADQRLAKACLGALREIRAVGKVQAKASALTLDKAWGPVFRADFTIDGRADPGLINRLVCWRRANGKLGLTYAIGQSIAPLPLK